MRNNGFTIATGFRRIRDLLRRGYSHAGPDRETLLLIFKSALAATIAWVVADTLLQAPSATFAPFSALLMVQVTVSRSMDQAIRFAIAVVVGVVLVAVGAPVMGQSIATLAVILLIALILGRWRRLGQQGPQVAVATVFAYSAFIESNGGSSFLQLLSIAGLVVLGSSIGVIVNLVILPPMRYRSAEYSVGALAQSVADLVTGVAEGLREGFPNEDQTEDWHYRSAQLPGMVTQTRESIEYAAETWRYNPRRLFIKEAASFSGHRTILNVLERGTEQVRAITRGLKLASEQGWSEENQARFLAAYADLLDAVAASVRILAEVDSVKDVRNERHDFDSNLRAGQEIVSRITGDFEGARLDYEIAWPIYTGLQTDAERLLEEFVQGGYELDQIARTGQP